MPYTEKDALMAARMVFPEAKSAHPLKKGYSHEVFEVKVKNKEVIVRFSNGNKGNHSLEKQIIVNKMLHEKGLPVPEVILYEKKGNRSKNEFVIMSKLQGHDVSELWSKMDEEEKCKVAELVGELLGKIHKIKLKEFGGITPEGIDNKHGRFKMKKVGIEYPIHYHVADYLARAFNDVGLLAAHDFIKPDFIVKIIKYITERKHLASTDEKPTLVHGDFEPRNIMIRKENNNWKISGLFDFEFSESRIREYDFLKLRRYGYFDDPKIKRALLKGYSKYQKIGKDFDKKVEFFQFIRDIGFAVFLLKAGNKELAMKTLHRVKKDIHTSQ